MPQPPDYAQPYDDGSSIPDYAQPYDEVGYTGSPYQGSKDVLSSLYDWIGSEYEQVKKNAAAAQTDLTAGNYPKAFYDIGSPLIDLWNQATGALGKDVSTYQSDVPGSGGFQVPQDPGEARKAGAQQAFGLTGIPIEKFQQAWEAKDYPRLAGQGATAAALLLAPHMLGKLRGGGEPVFGSNTDAWQGPPSNPALRFGVPSPPEEAVPPTPASAGIEARFNQKLPAGTDLGFNPETVQEPHLPFTVPDYAKPYESTTPAAPQGPGQIGLPLEGTSYEEGQATPQTPRYPPGTPLHELPATITLQEPTKLKIEQQRQRGYVPLEENEDGSLRLIRKDLATETSQSAPPSGESVDALRQRLADVLNRQQQPEGETVPTQERPNIVVAKTSADIDRWLAQGYKIINQRSPDNYIQMIPGDAVAPEANTPVQAAGEKIAVNANGELPVPDDKLTVKFQKKLESKGWTLGRSEGGTSFFKRLGGERGSVNAGGMYEIARDFLRRAFNREPTEEEVRNTMAHDPLSFTNEHGESVDRSGRSITPEEAALHRITDPQRLQDLQSYWESRISISNQIGDTQGAYHATHMLSAIREQQKSLLNEPPIETTVIPPNEPAPTSIYDNPADWGPEVPEPRSIYPIAADLRQALRSGTPNDTHVKSLIAEVEQSIESATVPADAYDNIRNIEDAIRYNSVGNTAAAEILGQLRDTAELKFNRLRNKQSGPSFVHQPPNITIPEPNQQELPMSLQLRAQNQLENISQAHTTPDPQLVERAKAAGIDPNYYTNSADLRSALDHLDSLTKEPRFQFTPKTGLTRAKYNEILASLDPANLMTSLGYSYSRNELSKVPIDKYKTGLWVEDTYPSFPEGRKSYDITYRDPDGKPIAHAEAHQKSQSEGGGYVLTLVADEHGGSASHRAVVKILFKLLEKDTLRASGLYSPYTKRLIEGLSRFVEEDVPPAESKSILQSIQDTINRNGLLNRLSGERGAVTIPSWEGIKRTIESAKQKTGIGMGETKPVAADDPGARYIDEVLGLTKSAMATGDLSAFRQTLAHVGTADFWKGQYKGVRSALSPEYDKAVDAEIKSKPIFQDHVDAEGNDIPAYSKQIGYKLLSDKKLSTRAEQIASNWLENGQFFGVPDNPVSRLWSRTYGDLIARPSERAYRTTLNYIGANRLEYLLDRAKDMSNDAALTGSARVGAMDQILRTKTKFTPEEAASMNPYTNLVLGREISDFVRTSIGQAPLKFYAAPFRQAEVNVESAAKLLTRSLFAPRSLFSKFRMLNPNTYIMASPFVRMQYMKAALATTAAWIGMAKMAQMAGADVTWNPINADFGKVRFGNTRLDFGQGYTPFLVSAFRLFTGQYTSSATKQTHEYGAGYNAPTQFDQLGRTIVGNKLEPFVAFSRDILAASDYQPFQVLDRTGQLFIAMSAQDTYDILRTNPKMLPFLVPPIVLGFSSQTYDSGKQKPKFIAPGHDIVVKRPALKKLIPGMSHH